MMRAFLLLAACALAACTPQPGNRADENATGSSAGVENSLAPLDPAAPGEPDGLANDGTPVAETPAEPGSAQEAATVVERYYALVEAGKYAEARALWGDGGGDSNQTPAAFAASFARFSEYHANIGAPGDLDPGAGQIHVTVPVQAYGRRKDGKPFDSKGEVLLHRVNNVDGATPEQLSWRIRSITLDPEP